MDFPEIDPFDKELSDTDPREFELQPWLLRALPQIQTLVHSNEPPEPAQVPSIQLAVQLVIRLDDKIAFAVDRLAQLEEDHANVTTHLVRHERDVLQLRPRFGEQILRWAAWLDHLKSARAQLTCCDNDTHAFKTILSPIRRVPLEILGEIFAWTVPAIREKTLSHPSTVADSLEQGPWALTHVCSRWRVVAISTPSLWSLVVLPYTRNSGPHYPLSMVQAQVERARTLEIYFLPNRLREKEASSRVETLKYLFGHSECWEEVNLDLTPELCRLLPALRDRVPALRKLRLLCMTRESERVLGSQPIDYFETATSLVHATIERWYRQQPLSFVLPANKLTHYHVDAPWEDHVEILRRSPTLVKAHITSSTEPVTESGSQSSMELPALRCLYVSQASILACLQVPNLDQLTLQVRRHDTFSQLMVSFEPFIAASSHRIRRLALQGVGDASFAFSAAEILQLFPAVTEAAIIFVRSLWVATPSWGHRTPTEKPNSNILVSRLEVDAATAIVSPGLTHIHLAFEEEKDPRQVPIDSRLILRMLKSRVDAPQCALREATLLFDPHTVKKSDHVLPAEWATLLQAGLGLSIMNGENSMIRARFMARWMCSPDWFAE
ncbi:hypothetical protein FB45DRAFT_1039971 [Roridomyces roridus]|uniref:F-box domain-containing protein n=1 Tax=Roridomyces roridus TaxID=1738132 RepID=A0AAD7FAB2_9AGAR|nr:hypothetical protein FB45DRAFT_1039971 [Roridomyces roridus]